jgi:p-aminobenzoyl-glutamate transporter AbgT
VFGKSNVGIIFSIEGANFLKSIGSAACAYDSFGAHNNTS